MIAPVLWPENNLKRGRCTRSRHTSPSLQDSIEVCIMKDTFSPILFILKLSKSRAQAGLGIVEQHQQNLVFRVFEP